MSGLASEMEFAYTKNDEHFHTTIGQWVDGVFAANASSIETVDTATTRVPLSDPNLVVWQMDQEGNPFLKSITGVVKIKLSSLPAYQLLKIRTENGSQIKCLSTTPVCTRINNLIDGKSADQYQIGDMICGTLKSYMLFRYEVRAIEYALNNSSMIPGIITATWGELSMCRTDALGFLQLCDDYPDQIDPGDKEVFNEVTGEMTVYDTVIEVVDFTSTYNKEYVYWVETENNCFQVFQNSALLGNPVPGPAWAPLAEKAKQVLADKGTGDAVEVLKTFNKESHVEPGPFKLVQKNAL